MVGIKLTLVVGLNEAKNLYTPSVYNCKVHMPFSHKFYMRGIRSSVTWQWGGSNGPLDFNQKTIKNIFVYLDLNLAHPDHIDSA